MVLSEGLQELWPTGVVLAFIGTFCGALGDVLVRKAFRKAGERRPSQEAAVRVCLSTSSGSEGCVSSEDEKWTEMQPQASKAPRTSTSAAEVAPVAVVAKRKSLFLDCCWLSGMVMTAIVDPTMITLALLFAPSSIVTPFAGAHILWACILAVLLLGERMHFLDILGAGMVVGGIVVVVVYASKAGDVQSVDDFIHGLKRTDAAICMFVLFFFLFTSLFFFCVKERSAVGRWWLKHVSPVGILLWGIDIKRLAVCATAGFLGGFTNTATKLLALELTRLFGDPFDTLQDWRFYFSVVLTLLFALPQLYFLNTALKHYGAVFVVPTVNACIIVSGSVAAFWILQERPTSLHICLLGLATVIAGVALLSRPASHASRRGPEAADAAQAESRCSAVLCGRKGCRPTSVELEIRGADVSYTGPSEPQSRCFAADDPSAYDVRDAQFPIGASSLGPDRNKCRHSADE